jgi:hypothetical protein
MIVTAWKNCAAWFLATAIPTMGAVVFRNSDASFELEGLLGLIALSAGQGFLAEIVGFRADESGFSFPRRLLPQLSFPVLWRRKIPSRHVSRVDTLGGRSIRVYLTTTEIVDFIFPNSDARKQFLQIAHRSYLGLRQTRQE